LKSSFYVGISIAIVVVGSLFIFYHETQLPLYLSSPKAFCEFKGGSWHSDKNACGISKEICTSVGGTITRFDFPKHPEIIQPGWMELCVFR